VRVYCGIDWAEGHHDIALVDGDGALVAKRRISESLEGVAELTAMLAAAGDSGADPVPVAIETPRGLLVAVLRPVNPLAVARYRERTSVSGKKSDHADAMTLANILRTDAHLHRRLPDDSALARSVSVLARAYQDAVWRRTKLVQELRARLREYCSGLLAAFASRAGCPPPSWPVPMPAPCWPSRLARPTAWQCRRPGSRQPCAAPAGSATRPPGQRTSSVPCAPRSCARTR
jgi:transposase